MAAKERQQDPQEPDISDKVVPKCFPKAPADLYGRLTLVEGMNYLSNPVPIRGARGHPREVVEEGRRTL